MLGLESPCENGLLHLNKTLVSAVIFDFDGIIVDTEPLHFDAFQRVLRPLGLSYSWEEYVSHYIGFDDRDGFREVFRSNSRSLDEVQLKELISFKAVVFRKIIENGVRPYPGAVELVRDLSGKIPLALCSGALLSDIVPILANLGIQNDFKVVVTAEDVAVSKPNSACYQMVLEKLSSCYPHKTFLPHNCIAIEDTPAGIDSAQGAGIPVIAVSNSYPTEALTSANWVLTSLEKIVY